MIIMIAVAIFIFSAYDNVTQDLAIEENRDTASFEASRLTVELQEYEDLLESEARILGALNESQPLQQDALASSSNRFAVFDGGVLLFDNYGTVIAAEPDRPEILGVDWSNRTYYEQIVRSEVSFSSVYSDIVSDGIDGRKVIVVAVPVTDTQGRFVGILSGQFNIGARSVSAFYGDIVKLNWSDDGNACVVDSTGKVIYCTNTNEIEKDVSNQDAVSQVLKGKSDAIRTDDLEGNSILASFAPISGTPWGLVMEKDWGALIGSNRGYRNILIFLLVLGVVLPTLIVYFGVRRITRPISDVSSAAKEIAAGNFSHRIVTKTGDELEEMANQFNLMAQALNDSYATLEQKVEDRTREEQRRTEQLRTVNEVGRSISSILQPEELFPYIVNSLRETFNYHNVGIVTINRDSGSLLLKASAGAYEGGPDIGTAPRDLRGIVSKVSKEGEPLLINDIPNDPVYRDVEDLGDTRSELAVPIKLGGQVLGVLHIEANRVNAFDELDLFTTQTLADQLAIAIENSRLYQDTRDMAIIEERNRLARDLHDAVSQTLFSASLIAEVLPRLWERNPEEAMKRLEEVRQLTRGALAEMRTLLLELRPNALIEAEFPHLLEQLGESIGSRTRAAVAVSVKGDCSLPDEVKIALYRIAQEALNNVAKHAGASEAKVDLICQLDKVTLTIADNGKGLDMSSLPPDSLGIGIMRERAADIGASLSVQSSVGHGTEIVVVWDNLSGEGKL